MLCDQVFKPAIFGARIVEVGKFCFIETKIYLIEHFFSFWKDGSKVFTASVDKKCKMWDLNSNQCAVVAQVMCTMMCIAKTHKIKQYRIHRLNSSADTTLVM